MRKPNVPYLVTTSSSRCYTSLNSGTVAAMSGVPDQQWQLLTEAELIEEMTLAMDVSRELRTLLEQILPDPEAWLSEDIHQWMDAQASTQSNME